MPLAPAWLRQPGRRYRNGKAKGVPAGEECREISEIDAKTNEGKEGRIWQKKGSQRPTWLRGLSQRAGRSSAATAVIRLKSCSPSPPMARRECGACVAGADPTSPAAIPNVQPQETFHPSFVAPHGDPNVPQAARFSSPFARTPRLRMPRQKPFSVGNNPAVSPPCPPFPLTDLHPFLLSWDAR